MKKPAIVLELEQYLGFSLKQENTVDKLLHLENRQSFMIDKDNNIIGLNLYNCEVGNLSFVSKLQTLRVLDLSYIKASNFTAIGSLENLIELDISGNNDIDNYSFIGKLKKLEKLNLYYSNISDISYISSLHNLNELYLSDNKVSNASALEGLSNLKTLVINKSLEIESFSFLSKLSNLTTLDLSGNNITDIRFLSTLINLNVLELYNNKISDISVLAKLQKLRVLNLSNNEVKDLNPISKLKNLYYLNLSKIKTSSFNKISGLVGLKELLIKENKIKSFSFLSKLSNLTTLDLSGNNITDIGFLSNLSGIKQLGLRNNSISDISPLLHLIRKSVPISLDGVTSDCISLKGNPFDDSIIALIGKGNKSIIRHFDRIIEEGIDYIYEAKITLVGDGSAGKTSLQTRLLNRTSPLPKKDNRTRGIEIHAWNFKEGKNKNHTAHIWDFGGQDVYYPVHRFFLTENSVFVLLASTRQSHHNFDYWIPTIYQFGGKSPIILGQTCFDGNKTSWNDIDNYIGNPNFNIIKTQALPYYEINLPNKNEGLNKIREAIVNQITGLAHYGKGVPKSWVPVRKKIAAESKRIACISFERFKEICKQSNKQSFSKLVDIKDCAKFLHSIGVVLWYYDNEELKNWVILQPEWAMNAVYKIIDDVEIQEASRRGNIFQNDFERLWQDQCYEENHSILKKMLEVFKIAFPKKHKKEDYIIPARLLSLPSDARWSSKEPYLRLEYKFEFMPKGIVNQISAELSRYITSDTEVWNNAVNFCSENNMAKCQVEEDFYNRRISIKSKGKDARSLAVMVMNSLKDITDGYKGVQPKIFVPCICSLCEKATDPESFSYEKLLKKLELNEKAVVTCNESDATFLISDLLLKVGLHNSNKVKNIKVPKGLKLFVSYSKFDEDYLQDFQDHLITLKEEGFISTFDCRQIEFGKEWDTQIKKEIDECDIMVCLVSVKFLNTGYIKKIEIEKAVEQNKIIIPIIIKACDWETSTLGRYQAAQRGKVVSLDNNAKLLGRIKGQTEEEKAAFWNDIIKELRRKIFTSA